MGCHFSDDGLVGLPQALPRGALLVVDDRVPMAAQDPEHILDQLAEALEKLSCTGPSAGLPAGRKMHRQRDLVRLLARELTVPLAAASGLCSRGLPSLSAPCGSRSNR